MLTSALRHLVYGTTILTLSVMLTACGGSSGGSGSSSSSSEASSSSSSIADTTPDDFGFTSLENQQPGEIVTSETITITGIDDAAEITIQNGQYSIDESDDFTAEAGQIRNEQTLTLQTTAPDTPSTTKEVTVTVGGVSAVFAVSTVEDTDPPEAAFVFPPPMTATEGNTVIVRGTAEDELSAVASVTLTVSHEGGTNDFEAESTDDFATWQKQVNLGPGENTITVVAEDEHGNTLTDGASVTVVQQAFVEAFPDDAVNLSSPKAVVFDEERNRLLIADSAEDRVIAVDLSTGVRSVFVNSQEGLLLDSANGLVIDAKRERLLVSVLLEDSFGVVGADLATGEKSLLNSWTHPSEDQPDFNRPSGLAVDPADPDQGYVLSENSDNLAALDLESGLRTLISDNDMPDSGTAFNDPLSLLIDRDNDRALVADSPFYIMEVDLLTGKRSVFLGEGVPDASNTDACALDLTTDDISKRIIFVEACARALWSMDVETQEITVLSDNSLPNAHNGFGIIAALAMAPSGEFITAIERDVGTVYAVDINTGARLIISKPTGEF